jgi:hypothetical protein
MDIDARQGNNARWALSTLLVLAVLAGAFRIHNLDLGLHARTGEWIVEHGEVPLVNVMSDLHADYPSVHDKWGFQVLTHALWDGVGPSAVVLVRISLIVGLFLLLWLTARRLGASPGSAMLFLVLGMVAMRSRFLFRPGLVSLLLLALVVYVILAARPDGRRAWWLVLLQLLWANLHGYFLLGYLAVGAVALGHLLRGAAGRQTGIRFAWLAVAMLAVSFVNPAGVDGFWHPVAILVDLNAHLEFYRTSIDEFMPTFAADPRQPYDRLAFFILGGFSIAVLLWEWWASRARKVQGSAESATPHQLDDVLLPAITLVGLFACMSPTLRRSMAPFVVVAAPLASAAFTARLGPRIPGLIAPMALAMLVGYGEITDHTSVHDGLSRRWGGGVSRLVYADRGIDFIETELPEHRVFTAFRYGSTFTGRLWPAQVASTNGNTHGYPTEYFMEVMEAVSMTDPIAFDRLSERYALNAALLPMDCMLAARLVRREDWKLVQLGVEEAVFVQAESVDADWLATHKIEWRLRSGQELASGDLPETPPPDSLLGLTRSSRPTTEIAAAMMLRRAGLVAAAQSVARQAAEHESNDAEAATLLALLEFDQDPPAARHALQRQLDRGGVNRFEAEARAAIEE